jgi:signal peptidase II
MRLAWALGLLLGGALGNLTDRFVREPGLGRVTSSTSSNYNSWFIGTSPTSPSSAAAILIGFAGAHGAQRRTDT